MSGQPLIETIRQVATAVVSTWWRDNGVSMTLARVESVDPLLVKPKGQIELVAAAAEDLVGNLNEGDVVRVARAGTAWIVVGRVGGRRVALDDLGVTASPAEINVLEGILASTAELNRLVGVTDGLQGQIDSKRPITPTSLPTTAHDLDDYRTPGSYVQNNNTAAAASTNYPAPNAGWLEVSTNAGGNMTWQRYTLYQGFNTATFIRGCYNNVWSSWRQFRMSDESVPGSWLTGTTSPAGTIYYRKWASFSEFRFLTTANVTNDVSTTVFTMPLGYRPTHPVPIAASGGAFGDRPVSGRVNADGTIVVRNNFSSALVVGGAAIYTV